MPSSRSVHAREIEATESHLIIHTGRGKTELRWEYCGEKLAQATWPERQRCQLSPAGTSIRWLLLDEDLAVGPLVLGKA